MLAKLREDPEELFLGVGFVKAKSIRQCWPNAKIKFTPIPFCCPLPLESCGNKSRRVCALLSALLAAEIESLLHRGSLAC